MSHTQSLWATPGSGYQFLMMRGWICGPVDARLQDLGAFMMEGSKLEAAVLRAVAAVRGAMG
jgi:hypothetical protein